MPLVDVFLAAADTGRIVLHYLLPAAAALALAWAAGRAVRQAAARRAWQATARAAALNHDGLARLHAAVRDTPEPGTTAWLHQLYNSPAAHRG